MASTTRQAAFHLFSKVQPDPASVTATPTREGARVPTLTAVAETALVLFEDLCALAGGKGAEWLGFDKGFATERVKIFALDAAAEIAADNAALFVDVPAFHHALRHKLCAALVTHLQSWQRSDVALRKDVDEIFFMCLPLMWVFIGPGSLCLRDDQPMKRPPDNSLGHNQNFYYRNPFLNTSQGTRFSVLPRNPIFCPPKDAPRSTLAATHS